MNEPNDEIVPAALGKPGSDRQGGSSPSPSPPAMVDRPRYSLRALFLVTTGFAVLFAILGALGLEGWQVVGAFSAGLLGVALGLMVVAIDSALAQSRRW